MQVRKQIVVPGEVDLRIRRLAAQMGVSQSAVIVQAIRALPEPEFDPQQQLMRILSFSGAIDGPPAALSEEIDAVLYGG
jgi:hypothetical protein